MNFFGVVSTPPLLAENDRLSQVEIAIHLVAQYPLYLFHGAVRRDGIVERMLPIRRAG